MDDVTIGHVRRLRDADVPVLITVVPEAVTPDQVGAVINCNIYAGFIVDGFHVADQMVGLAIRARPVPDRMLLVSDAMPTVGRPAGFLMYGEEVALRCGRLVRSDGTLAGACLTLSDAVAHMVRRIGLDRQSALGMGITAPAALMGLDDPSRVEGRPV